MHTSFRFDCAYTRWLVKRTLPAGKTRLATESKPQINSRSTFSWLIVFTTPTPQKEQKGASKPAQPSRARRLRLFTFNFVSTIAHMQARKFACKGMQCLHKQTSAKRDKHVWYVCVCMCEWARVKDLANFGKLNDQSEFPRQRTSKCHFIYSHHPKWNTRPCQVVV